MVFVRDGYQLINGLKFYKGLVYPTPSEDLTITIDYWAKPKPPKWGYVVVNGKPLYNSNTSVDFSLHPSEEGILLAKILALCGVILNKQELIGIGDGMEQGIKQSQND